MMGFSPSAMSKYGLTPPPPFSSAGQTPGYALAAMPEEMAISTMLGNKAGAILPGSSVPSTGPTPGPTKKGGGGFTGFQPNEAGASLQAPMTGNKTLTGQ